MLGIFLDTETNGLNIQKHHIIEIAYQIVDLRNGSIKSQYESIIFISFKEWEKSDPVSLKVNGFSWEDVKRGKEPQIIAKEIQYSFHTCSIQKENAIFICQNPSFDRAFFNQIIDSDMQEYLHWPYHWLDLASMYWMRCLLEGKEPWKGGISKNHIATTYNLPCEATPHKAMNGVKHLLDCYKAVANFPQKLTNS